MGFRGGGFDRTVGLGGPDPGSINTAKAAEPFRLPPLVIGAVRSRAVEASQKIARRRRGFQSTILTGAQGLLAQANIQRKTLLGQ